MGIKPFRDKIVLATKCGVRFDENQMLLDSSRRPFAGLWRAA